MTIPSRRFLRLAMGAAALPAMPRIARAQAYHSRQIRLIAPFPPGGAYDAIARPWAEKMKSLLGTVVVENIGGGGASIGSAAVAHPQPDGYTLLTAGTLTHVNEALIKARPLYDPVKDIDPISGIAAVVLGVVVHPSVPAQDLKELAAYARKNPNKVHFANNGVGTTNHLTYEMLRDQADLPNLVQVPYRGAGPVLVDLIAGQVTLSIVGNRSSVSSSQAMRRRAATSSSATGAAARPGSGNRSSPRGLPWPRRPAGSPRPRRSCRGQQVLPAQPVQSVQEAQYRSSRGPPGQDAAEEYGVAAMLIARGAGADPVLWGLFSTEIGSPVGSLDWRNVPLHVHRGARHVHGDHPRLGDLGHQHRPGTVPPADPAVSRRRPGAKLRRAGGLLRVRRRPVPVHSPRAVPCGRPVFIPSRSAGRHRRLGGL